MPVDNLPPAETGRHLARLRDKAGMKQAALAKALDWNQARLSRIESGERPVSTEELDAILGAISSPETQDFRRAVERSWAALDRPALDHPDQDLLWEAESVALELEAVRQRDDVSAAFDKRLESYLGEFKRAAASLIKREHQVAFVGSIGIGKSTAICKLAGLEIPGANGQRAVPVLEVGAGGTTVCEVHLKTGPDYGLAIEPKTDSEMRSDISDFADLFYGDPASDSEPDSSGEQALGISKEVERAIRNMSALKKTRSKAPDGKLIRRDEAQELANTIADKREFMVEVLSRMELHRRDRRDVWFDPAQGKPPFEWLRETFEKINNGRHPEFAIPKRIEVSVPTAFVNLPSLSVRVIDTKGIDRSAARPDLESLFDDSHTSTVLCSSFNNAPSAETRQLLERAKEAGYARHLLDRVTLLVLPRPEEATAVKDDSGSRVESAEEGYLLKGEQAGVSLQPLNLEELKIEFFNSMEDDPSRIRELIESRVDAIRDAFRRELKQLIDQAKAMLLNLEQEQARAITRQAAGILKTALYEYAKPRARNVHVYDSLLQQLREAHVGTVRATVNRDGEWHNLNYQHHLGFGARRVVMQLLGDGVDSFVRYCEVTSKTSEYSEATELFQQAARTLQSQFDELLRRIQLMGQTAFADELKQDPHFWIDCYREWGKGPGYRNRVMSRNQNWFSEEKRVELERKVQAILLREWEIVLERVKALLEVDI